MLRLNNDAGFVVNGTATVGNIPVTGVGHLSMPNNGQVAFKITSALAELDPFETRRAGPPLNLGAAKNDLL